jgi:hypothetical protein
MTLLPIGNRLRQPNDPKIAVRPTAGRWAIFTPIETDGQLFFAVCPMKPPSCGTTWVSLHFGLSTRICTGPGVHAA